MSSEVCRYKHDSRIKKDGWTCHFCGERFCTRRNMWIHIRETHNKDSKYICRFCGKQYERNYQVAAHTARCKLNPNYEKTMEKQNAKQRERAKRGIPEEVRRKISNSMKRYLEEHPESASYKYNHYSKGSWAEDYFKDLFVSENVLDWEQQFRVGRYRLDFAFVKDFVDFEVDGHQHKWDKRIIAHDFERTQKLCENGWTVVRILWSDWQKMSFDDRKTWLKNNLYCHLSQFK